VLSPRIPPLFREKISDPLRIGLRHTPRDQPAKMRSCRIAVRLDLEDFLLYRFRLSCAEKQYPSEQRILFWRGV
jgi:hypothetical protein